MKAPQLSKSNVPSSTLLKFLRAQKDGYPFFTPNHLHDAYIGRGAANSLQCSRRHAKGQLSGTFASRSMTTFAPMYPVESSLLPLLDSLWPDRKKRRQPSESASEQRSSSPSYLSRYTLSPSESHTRNVSSQGGGASSREFGQHQDESGPFNLWRRFRQFGGRKRRSAAPLQPDDLPAISRFLDDGSTLGRTLRPANELRLRCTEFDENGNVTVVNGEFKKSELIAKYGLLPRDLRKIDSSLLPNILVRPAAIMINLLHLRVLIKHNRVLVFDAYGSTDSYTQSLFMYDLEGKLRSPEGSATRTATPSIGALPYEFRALEAILISVTSGLEAEFEGVREPVVRVLRELEEDIDRDNLRYLLIYSKKLGTFEQKARLVRDAIDDLLEADDDLAAMYLTEKWGPLGRQRGEDDHTEVEMLLESYHKVCDEIVQVSGNLVSNIRNTEEMVKAILDANRNSLMLLDLKFSIGTLGLGGGTFVAALYGMNLKNFIEDSDLGFWGVSAWCTVFSVAVLVYGLRKLRRVQRISMWGSTGAAASPAAADGGGLLGWRAWRGERPIRGRAGWAQLPDQRPPAPHAHAHAFQPAAELRRRHAPLHHEAVVAAEALPPAAKTKAQRPQPAAARPGGGGGGGGGR